MGAGLPGGIKFRESNLPAFHRPGFVGGRAVWVAKISETTLVCVLVTGLVVGRAAWRPKRDPNLSVF